MLCWSSSLVAGGVWGGEAAATVAHQSTRNKKGEGFIQSLMEMTAATATARGGDDGGVGDNDDNGMITMVINLNLRTAGVRQ